ncbi:MAG: exodeoxyribonuclease V subunit gamma [Burkholderiaceae bacterium]|nr:exodeoxyribonuclease V subunit gamma [Burkholderiaceae bacterium]
MLHLHLSNRFERLEALLLERLAAHGDDPFEPDTVVVPSAAVQRRLTLAIARAHGVCAGVEFGFLAQWLWRQMRRVLPQIHETSPLAPAVLAWRIYAALGDAGFVAGQPRLQRYLDGADELMRLELSQRIATLLDQYATYRPGWLGRWQQGERVIDPAGMGAAGAADEAWQAALWQRLAADLGLAATHPAARFVAALESGGEALARGTGLPRCAHLFALPTLPPLHAELLAQLGRWTELHVYLLNPCQEYWYEVVDRKRLAWLAARGRAEGHEVGNRLLAAWGRQTQALVDTLLERSGDAAVDDHRFEPAPGATLLARWQNAVLAMEDLARGSVDLAADDRSVELHVGHSLTRELEVLHDRLLAMFAADPTLQPGDVLVVTPDLEAAAPLIDAVFGTAPPGRLLPYAITGRARSRVNAPARALLALLDLAASRCGASELFALLQQPIVARRFGLDDAALAEVHAALLAGGLRWGLDADHRAAAGLPADARHTLADALDRLFLGHAMPPPRDAPSDPIAGLLPAGDLEGSDARVLGALHRFAEALGALRTDVQQPLAPARWVALLHELLARFTAPAADELDDLAELHDGLRTLADTLARAELATPLPLAVLRHALEQALDDPARGGVPSGHITFSAMSPLRGLPYEVVCLVGLNGDAFPGAERAGEFDLMAARMQRGDRQRRQDDRNLFLDLLLAARRAVHLSHTGRSVRDHTALPPSVLVDEWLDVLVPAIAADPDDPASIAAARARLVVEHPLQPFALQAFRSDADPRVRSHRAELCEALQQALAAQAQAPAAEAWPDAEDEPCGEADEGFVAGAVESLPQASWAPPLPFFTASLPPPGPEWRSVTLAQLVEFFRQPARFLLRRRLALALPRDADELRDDEPFVPEREPGWALADRLLPAALAGANEARLLRLAEAGTEWPAGAVARQPLRRLLAELIPFAERVRAVSAGPTLPPHTGALDFDLDGEAWQLGASHADLRPGGLLRWRAAPLQPRDRLEAWLHHLWLHACPPLIAADARRAVDATDATSEPDASASPGARCGPGPTRWLAFDATLALRAPASSEAARELLASLLRIYRRGLIEPLPFFPKASWAFVDADGSFQAARKAFEPTRHHAHAEGADAAIRLVWRGRGDVLGDDFAALAQVVYRPLREHIEPEA